MYVVVRREKGKIGTFTVGGSVIVLGQVDSSEVMEVEPARTSR